MLWLLLFGVCPFPLAQNKQLGPKPESQKWGTELNWKTIITIHSSLALWCVFCWSVKLSGEGKENHHPAGLQSAHSAKTNLGGRWSWLLGMEKTYAPSLCWNDSNIQTVAKPFWGKQCTSRLFLKKKKTIPWAKRSSNAFYRTNWGNQKGGQEHQRQFSDLVFFPQFYPANIQTSGCVLKLYNLKEKNT